MVTRAYGDADYFETRENVIENYYNSYMEVKDEAAPDEAIVYYKRKGYIGAFSICLPTNDDKDICEMHTTS